MKLKLYFVFPVISVLFLSCHLHREEKNWGEYAVAFEPVLAHCKDDPLKYRAACFLIENMPGHYSSSSPRLKERIAELRLLSEQFLARHQDISLYRAATMAYDSLKKTNRNLGWIEYTTRYDTEVVTPEYLIENIELAVGVWRKVP